MDNERATSRKIRLAIIDDVSDTVDIISRLVALDSSIDLVGTATDGQEAIKLFDSVQPDVMIMGVLMPVMDGLTATKIICEQRPSARIIILTATAPELTKDRAIEAGASLYLSKPVSADELLGAIHTLVQADASRR